MNTELSHFIARLLSVALALGPLAVVSSVHAASPPTDKVQARQAEVVAAQAKQAFRDRQFEYAARLFMEAYAISKQPALLYNAGRAYEEAGKSGDAATLFRLYATISDDPDGIADAWARIKQLESKSELAAPDSGKPATPKPGEPQSADGTPASSASAESVPADGKPLIPKPDDLTREDRGKETVLPSRQQPADAGPGKAKPVEASVPESRPNESAVSAAIKQTPDANRAWAWVATGSAAVMVGGGVVVAWLGAQKTHDANQLPLRSQADITAYHASFDRAELLTNAGISLIAVGVVAAATAAWLHLRKGAAVTAGADGRGGVWLAGRW